MTLWWISAPQCMGMLITAKALVMFLSLRTEDANKILSVFPCSSFLFPVKSLYNLDEDQSQEAIAINLLPLVSQSELGRATAGASHQSKRYFDTYLWDDCKGKGNVFICALQVPDKELVREFTSFQCSPFFDVKHTQIGIKA